EGGGLDSFTRPAYKGGGVLRPSLPPGAIIMVRLAIVFAALTLCGFLTFAWTTMPDAGADHGPSQTGEFASQRGPDKDGTPVAFDGKRAMGYLREICAIGPRISGTPGFKQQVDLIQQ